MTRKEQLVLTAVTVAQLPLNFKKDNTQLQSMRFKEVDDFGSDFLAYLHRAKLIPLDSGVSLIFCF